MSPRFIFLAALASLAVNYYAMNNAGDFWSGTLVAPMSMPDSYRTIRACTRAEQLFAA
jgi:hypothetical protein